MSCAGCQGGTMPGIISTCGSCCGTYGQGTVMRDIQMCLPDGSVIIAWFKIPGDGIARLTGWTVVATGEFKTSNALPAGAKPCGGPAPAGGGHWAELCIADYPRVGDKTPAWEQVTVDSSGAPTIVYWKVAAGGKFTKLDPQPTTPISECCWGDGGDSDDMPCLTCPPDDADTAPFFTGANDATVFVGNPVVVDFSVVDPNNDLASIALTITP